MRYKKIKYERTDTSEGIDLEKSDKSKECMICHYWYLKTLIMNMNHMFVRDVMIYQWWSMI